MGWLWGAWGCASEGQPVREGKSGGWPKSLSSSPGHIPDQNGAAETPKAASPCSYPRRAADTGCCHLLPSIHHSQCCHSAAAAPWVPLPSHVVFMAYFTATSPAQDLSHPSSESQADLLQPPDSYPGVFFQTEADHIIL